MQQFWTQGLWTARGMAGGGALTSPMIVFGRLAEQSRKKVWQQAEHAEDSTSAGGAATAGLIVSDACRQPAHLQGAVVDVQVLVDWLLLHPEQQCSKSLCQQPANVGAAAGWRR